MKFDMYLFTKRAIDILGSVFGLILLSPFFLLIALLIKFESRGTVLFKQERIGRFEKAFRIFKFRTMVENAQEMGPQVSRGDDQRITRIGRFLRRYKLDELPQLINVLRGEMSLVGPRPEVSKYIDIYRDDYREILRIKPGITDIASLKYRNENEMLDDIQNVEEFYLKRVLPVKIRYYRFYLKKQGICLDMYIIFKTLFSIVKK